MSIKFYIAILFLFVFGFTASSQEYLTKISEYTTEDGLSSRYIHDLFEDARGYVWALTNNSLNRFDGHEFKVFDKENSGLYSNDCRSGVEDIHGNIWLGFRTTGSKRFFAWKTILTPEFEVVIFFFLNKAPFLSEEIVSVNQLNRNELYLLTNKGELYKYNGNFEKITKNEKLTYSSLLHVDENGTVYALSLDQRTLFEVNQNKVQKEYDCPEDHFSPVLKDETIYLNYVEIVSEGKKRVLLVNKNDTINLLQTFQITMSENERRRSGMGRFSPGTKCFSNFFLYENVEELFGATGDRRLKLVDKFNEIFPNEEVEIAFETRRGKIWFRTSKSLYQISYRTNQFQNFLQQKEGILSCRGFFKLKPDKFLLNTYSGTKFLNPQNGNYNDFIPNLYGFRQSVQINNDELLFGMYGREVFIQNLKTGKGRKIKLIAADRKGAKRADFLIPFKDKSGKIWVGCDNVMIEYLPDQDSIRFFRKLNDFSSFDEVKIHWFEEFEDGIWIATTDGLFVLDSEIGLTAHYRPVLGSEITHLYREDTIFWIATYGDGLVKWNSKTGETTSFGLKKGLLDAHLMAVYPDKNDYLWVTTNKGLARFDRKSKTFKVFLESEGINQNEFNISSHFQDDDGKLFFGGMNGVTAFYPENIVEEIDSSSKLVITVYEEIDEKTLKKIDKTSDFLKNKSIVAKPSLRSFTLKFALLNYENTKETRYAYKIDGSDEEWIFQKENSLRLNRLPYGKFTLKLKALDYRGNFSEEMKIPLEVIAPIHLQLKWQIFAAMLLTGLIWLQFRIKLKNAQNKEIELEKIVTERTDDLENLNRTKDRLFAILAHDLRNPVLGFEDFSETLNYLIQKNDTKQLLKFGNHIEVEAKQLHHLLDNLLLWALAQRDELPAKSQELNLFDLTSDSIKNYRSLEKRIGVTLINDVPKTTKVWADKRVLDTIFRNVITNAFRYTSKGGNITISARKEDNFTRINIQDTGKGMTAKRLKTLFKIKTADDKDSSISTISLGMHLCQELIESIDGQIFASSKLGEGTIVSLKLPFKPSNF